METIKSSLTERNLQIAFASESLACRQYLAYAARAERDGFPGVAALFREVADCRCNQALRHMEMLEASLDTKSRSAAYDLRAAIMQEVHDHSDLYPSMARTAREEGFEDIAAWLEVLAKSTRLNISRFHRALGELL